VPRLNFAIKPVLSIAMALLAAAVLMIGTAPTAHAATITVDINTGGTCTLIDAITAANTGTTVGGCTGTSGADNIVLESDETMETTACLP